MTPPFGEFVSSDDPEAELSASLHAAAGDVAALQALPPARLAPYAQAILQLEHLAASIARSVGATRA